LLSSLQKKIKEKKPKTVQSLEVQDFHLGTAPPMLGLQHTYWSMESGGQPVLHMGFEWDTNEMSVLLAAKLAGPLRGMAARIVINSLHIKGDVRLQSYSLLRRQGNLLCAFESLRCNVARTYLILDLVVMYFAVTDYANLGWAGGSLLI
jgi:hypothetical protein